MTMTSTWISAAGPRDQISGSNVNLDLILNFNVNSRKDGGLRSGCTLGFGALQNSDSKSSGDGAMVLMTVLT